MKPKHPNPPARPSSPVMKPRMMVADNDPGYPPEVAFQVYPREEDRGRDDLTPIPVLVLDMSPAGQEWLVEEVAEVVEDERKPRPFCRDCADNNGVCPHTQRYCDPNKQTAFAILARLQRLAKGGKGR